jgi:hypothetical protein
VSPTVRTGGFDSSDVEDVYSKVIEISIVFTHTPAFLLCTTSPMLLPSLFKSSDALAALFEIVIFKKVSLHLPQFYPVNLYPWRN